MFKQLKDFIAIFFFPGSILFSLSDANAVITPTDGYGIYESCSPAKGQECYDHLRTLSKYGYSLVLNYASMYGTDKQIIAYADAAQAQHMKIIWQVGAHYIWDGTDARKTYPDLAASCHCSDNEALIRHVIALVKGHPATWGYYVGDEVSPKDHDMQKHYSDIVKQSDPSHPRLIVLGTKTCSSGRENCSANKDLALFTDSAEVIAQDYYPIGYYEDFIPYTQTGTIAIGVQKIADHYHVDSGMVLQATSWQDYYPPARCSPYPHCAPFPTKQQQHVMLSQVLEQSRPRLVLWYSYYDAMQSPAREDNLPKPSDF